MSAQEYFGGSSQNPPRREESHTPGPWNSSTPGPDTPRTSAYSPYPPSENYYRPNSNPNPNPNQNYYASPPDPRMAQGSWNGPSPSPSLGGEGYPHQPYGQQPQPPYPQHGGPSPTPSGYPPYPPQEGGGAPYNDRPYSPYQQQQQQQPGPQQPPPYSTNPNLPPGATDDQDRGFLGAVTGGAAGAFAGHKVNHGFLGAIGGALTGSVAEDAIKNHRKKKEEEEKEALRRQKEALKEQKRREKEERKMQRRADRHHRRHSCSSSSSSSSSSSDDERKHHPGRTFRGNFSGSSREIRLEGYHELVAYCGDVDGRQHRSVIPLNDVLTNSWGEFKWARHGNFAASASNVHLEDGGRVLVADLGDGNGGWKRSWIRLDERISNQNGRLVFLD
ncbi:putative glutamine-serine-proline rich protein [Aspergillus fijiensis CBS 313.89]|uniref:CNVH-domain-containing protein n=1 Tax=Aspergillus fijiensis CBS 313.89 TaxID=1448319 RepID=A0A8G1RMF6_9EURO|nr:CNVH-domain-containing protein [Aspergillus fijiensis CBS 313.89]RAK74096.1 CNVH-domain-containing protein [Aspergillus fijiensis CBS 313.89]